MYSDVKQVQIIISLLKQFNIKHIVISPGTRHVPLVHSVEIDSYFSCYSVVDERSAAYFALGLSEALDRPVCVTCTSATATCNYMPAMREAYERNIQLVALTADRARYQRFHMENQCIDQVNMYTPFVKYAVDVPDVKTDEDYWYCNRCVNEALLELNHNGKGPVQINFLEPLTMSGLTTFSVQSIPLCRKIDRIEDFSDLQGYINILCSKKKILVICGQHLDKTGELNLHLNNFFAQYNSVITYDYYSNVYGDDFISSPLLSDVINVKECKKVMPDLIISFGTKIYSTLGVRYRNCGIEHWHIAPDGMVNDFTHSLKKVFAFTAEIFFKGVVSNNLTQNDKEYYSLWKKIILRIRINDIPFTNFSVIREIISNLPPSSAIHTSVLNSMRFTNFCILPPDTICFGNIGTDGIDGALSSFLGQASVSERISLLIIGDLSYLYDLNASLINMNSNIRILLINNFAGAEFHYNIGVKRIKTLNENIAAGHHTKIEQTSDFSNFDYWTASDKTELRERATCFFKKNDKPILLEVFTDAYIDGASLRNFFNKNRVLTFRNKSTRIANKIFGRNNVLKIRQMFLR